MPGIGPTELLIICIIGIPIILAPLGTFILAILIYQKLNRIEERLQ